MPKGHEAEDWLRCWSDPSNTIPDFYLNADHISPLVVSCPNVWIVSLFQRDHHFLFGTFLELPLPLLLLLLLFLLLLLLLFLPGNLPSHTCVLILLMIRVPVIQSHGQNLCLSGWFCFLCVLINIFPVHNSRGSSVSVCVLDQESLSTESLDMPSRQEPRQPKSRWVGWLMCLFVFVFSSSSLHSDPQTHQSSSICLCKFFIVFLRISVNHLNEQPPSFRTKSECSRVALSAGILATVLFRKSTPVSPETPAKPY